MKPSAFIDMSPVPKKLRRLCAVFAAASAMFMSGCGLASSQDVRTAPSPAAVTTQAGCVSNADTAALARAFPDLAAEFNRASQLPLTGKPVTDVIANPANGFTTCEVKAFDDPHTGGKLEGKTLEVLAKDPNRQAYMHEIFHGVQTVNGSLDMIGSGKLDFRDGMEGNMIVEAAAVGYTFTVYKEMSKVDPAAYDRFTATGYSFGMRDYFDTAYDAAMASNANLPARQREAKALEAGGKAVVEALTSGKDPGWAFNYALTSVYNNARGYALADRDNPQYMKMRDDYFRRAGAVSPSINITPDELIGQGASRSIVDHLENSGVHISFQRR